VCLPTIVFYWYHCILIIASVIPVGPAVERRVAVKSMLLKPKAPSVNH